MKPEIKKRKNGAAKTFLASVLMVGAVTAIFYGMTQVAVAAENSKVTALPTVYPVSARTTTTPGQTKEQDGYGKCPNRRRICSNIELLQISSERSGLRGSGF
jgi:hypothetical protein